MECLVQICVGSVVRESLSLLEGRVKKNVETKKSDSLCFIFPDGAIVF